MMADCPQWPLPKVCGLWLYPYRRRLAASSRMALIVVMLIVERIAATFTAEQFAF